MLLQGTVGPTLESDGVSPTGGLRQGRLGDGIVSELHGRYYEQVVRKNVFTAYCAAQSLSAVGTGMVGLQIWNGSPVVGGINIVLLKCYAMVFATSASLTRIFLATGVGQTAAPSGQTAATRVSNNFIGGTGPQATAVAAGTFTAAPTALFPILHNTAAIASTGQDSFGFFDFEGSIILPPQTY